MIIDFDIGRSVFLENINDLHFVIIDITKFDKDDYMLLNKSIKIMVFTMVSMIYLFPLGQQITYSNSNSYENRLLNPNPDVVYMTGDISSILSIDLYEITLEQHQQIRKHQSRIEEISLDNVKPCLSNLDYSEIRLAYYPNKDVRNPEKKYCFVVFMKNKGKLSNLTTKHRTFISVIDGEYRELMPYVVPAVWDYYKRGYYDENEIKNILKNKKIEIAFPMK